MKRVLLAIVVFCTSVLYPILAFAEEAVAETMPDVDSFWTAIAANNWPLAVGIGLTILVWVFRKFIVKKIPKKAMPWVSLALAVIGTAGTRIVQATSESRPWWQGMVQGILEGAVTGFVAMGAWDIKQTVVKKE